MEKKREKKTWKDTVKMRSARVAVALKVLGGTRIREATDEDFAKIENFVAGAAHDCIEALRASRTGGPKETISLEL